MTNQRDHIIVNLPSRKRGTGSIDEHIDREIERIKAEVETARKESV